MTTVDDSRDWLMSIENKLENIQQAIYGNKMIPNGGGVYGELRRVRDEIRSNAQDRMVALAAMEKRMQSLESRLEAVEDKVDAIDRRIRPVWWDWVIIGGGVAIAAMVVLQLMTLAGR
jgi:hypothetical protein